MCDDISLAPCKHCGVVPVLNAYTLCGQTGFVKWLYMFECNCGATEQLYANKREAYETWNEENKETAWKKKSINHH